MSYRKTPGRIPEKWPTKKFRATDMVAITI
jgi:hypothetical protein